MNVLVVNDDGILSEGIKALADFLSEKHNVIVVAPDGNRSAFSHSLSIFKDIFVNEITISNKYKSYAMSGTPADCVKFAMHYFSNLKFDMVCSGINKGHNLGSDTVYSGTISACLEGNFFGVKGIAFSNYAHDNCDFGRNIEVLRKIFDKLCDMASGEYTLNVNLPNDMENGIAVAPLGVHLYSDAYVSTGDNVYQLVGESIDNVKEEKTDVWYAKKGFVTITPILYNRTAFNAVNKFKDYKF